MGQLSGLDYSAKVVLVTGGTKGIGAGIACRFLQAGARVIVCGRSVPQALPQAGGAQAIFMACDVRDPDSLKALFEGIRADFGHLDVLVNNAGGSPAAEAASVSPRFHEGIIRLNLIAPLNVAQQANVLMQQQANGGCIVFIGSISALRASPGTAAYGAAKAGLLNLTQSLAQEWGPQGIRVNAIIAGLMQTETAETTYGDAAAQAAVGRSMPLQRMGTGLDIAGAVLWLCSDLASWVSGARINVDGGGERPYFLDLVKGN